MFMRSIGSGLYLFHSIMNLADIVILPHAANYQGYDYETISASGATREHAAILLIEKIVNKMTDSKHKFGHIKVFVKEDFLITESSDGWHSSITFSITRKFDEKYSGILNVCSINEIGSRGTD